MRGDYYVNPVFISISIFFLSLVLSKTVFYLLSLSNKLFIYCSSTSYSIYLFHTILMVGISYLVYLLCGINSYTAISIYSIFTLLIAVFHSFHISI